MPKAKDPETVSGPETGEQELITVQLPNAIRTSAGDYSSPGIVTLPADEARDLIRSRHAVRWAS